MHVIKVKVSLYICLNTQNCRNATKIKTLLRPYCSPYWALTEPTPDLTVWVSGFLGLERSWTVGTHTVRVSVYTSRLGCL